MIHLFAWEAHRKFWLAGVAGNLAEIFAAATLSIEEAAWNLNQFGIHLAELEAIDVTPASSSVPALPAPSP